MNGNVSSAIPNTAPQSEKKNITTGMIIHDLFFKLLISLPIPASMAQVSLTTVMAPPTMKMKKVICAVS